MTSPSHSSDEDFLESLGISLDEVNVTVDADAHASVTGIYAQTWAFEYFPCTRPELIRADLGLGLVPLAWRWYRSNLYIVQRKKSLRDLRAFFDTCSLEQVDVGPMIAHLQSWIQVDPHFQRPLDLDLIVFRDRHLPSRLAPILLELRVPQLGLQGGGFWPLLLLPLRLRVRLGPGLATWQVLLGLPGLFQRLPGRFTQAWPIYVFHTAFPTILLTAL
ncbi:hypothetical protein JCGZ_10633 [Jatropha curcas]|uniref:Aminotransferase-like plant mobile domain-containing protein n=1 Tax=Jatropha curcas TaxID=180498 RepID=A0A067KVF0_JATCU|nr:hypothetical protein JCGZ_10633 [Jatropha curcas]